MTYSIVAVAAGTSTPSSTRMLADRLAGAAAEALGDADVSVIELRPLAHAIADAQLTGFPAGELAEAVETVNAADGLVLVSPTFTASYSGLFKSFIDVLEPDSLRGRPTLLGATGGSPRHSLVLDHALRPLTAYLGMLTAPTGVFAATADWGAPELDARITRAGAELAGLIGGAGPVARPRDEWSDPVPMAELLGG